MEREFVFVVVIVVIDWYNGFEGYSDFNVFSLVLVF